MCKRATIGLIVGSAEANCWTDRGPHAAEALFLYHIERQPPLCLGVPVRRQPRCLVPRSQPQIQAPSVQPSCSFPPARHLSYHLDQASARYKAHFSRRISLLIGHQCLSNAPRRRSGPGIYDCLPSRNEAAQRCSDAATPSKLFTGCTRHCRRVHR